MAHSDDPIEEMRSAMASLLATRDEHRERAIHERHQENRELMQEILREARKTNGRITTLEAIVGYLKDEWKLIRERYHAMINARQAGDTGDGAIVHRVDIKTALALYVGGIASVVALLKMLGKL